MSEITVKNIEGIWMISQAGAASLCGVTVQTVINWAKQDNAPKQDPRSKFYPLAELGRWIREEQIFKQGRGNSLPWLPDMSRIKGDGLKQENDTLRLERLKADKLEIEIAEKRGELLPVGSVRRAWETIVMRVKTKLTQLPTNVAPLVHKMQTVYDVQERLSASVREILEELADDWQNVEDSEADDEEDD